MTLLHINSGIGVIYYSIKCRKIQNKVQKSPAFLQGATIKFLEDNDLYASPVHPVNSPRNGPTAWADNFGRPLCISLLFGSILLFLSLGSPVLQELVTEVDSQLNPQGKMV